MTSFTMRKRLVSLSAGAALAVGILGGSTAVAAASQEASPTASRPTGCDYGPAKDKEEGLGTHAYCSSGGGYYKAVVNCKRDSGSIINRPAADWRKPGGKHSYVFCPAGTAYSSSGIMTKAG
jgi:hypothetical protein